jgi:hypothetical protein
VCGHKGDTVLRRPVTFSDVVEPLRTDFAIDPATGFLTRRQARPTSRLVSALSLLRCLAGHAVLTPPADPPAEAG